MKDFILTEDTRKQTRENLCGHKFLMNVAFLVDVFRLRLDCMDMGIHTPMIHRNLTHAKIRKTSEMINFLLLVKQRDVVIVFFGSVFGEFEGRVLWIVTRPFSPLDGLLWNVEA
jgi:hypothetical protein